MTRAPAPQTLAFGLACAAFAASAATLVVRRDGREAAWAVAALASALGAALAPRGSGWDVVLVALTLALGLRDVGCTTAGARALAAAGVVATLTAAGLGLAAAR